jgi:endoglucanase
MFKILKKYTEIPGPIGHEHRVHKQFKNDLEKFSDDVTLTNVGNVLAHFPGKGKKVILVGHADEICYYVQSITDNGFLCINSAKSRHDYVDYPYSLVGQKALVIGDDNDLRGVFIAPSGHILRGNEKNIPLEVKNVSIDLGLSSRKEVEDLGIHVGCPIIWNPETEKLNGNAFGKAMDDRLSHAIMLKLAEKLTDVKLNFDVYMASTVQEEVFLLGAHALNRGDYDVSLAIDIGVAGDYPPLEKNRMPIKLGEGPVIVYKDSQAHYNIEIIKELRKVAEKNEIPFQHGIFYNYGSDSGAMIKGGIKPNLIAPPCRYTHSPYETVNLKDLENTVDLLQNYLT